MVKLGGENTVISLEVKKPRRQVYVAILYVCVFLYKQVHMHFPFCLPFLSLPLCHCFQSFWREKILNTKFGVFSKQSCEYLSYLKGDPLYLLPRNFLSQPLREVFHNRNSQKLSNRKLPVNVLIQKACSPKGRYIDRNFSLTD